MVKIEKIQTGIIIGLVVLLVFVSLNPGYFSSWKNKEKVYSLELIRIEGCEDCADLSAVSQAFSKSPTLKIKEETVLDYQSKDAQEFLKEYDIQHIPALIVLSKNIGQLPLENTAFRKEEEKNAAIFEQAVPYLDLASSEVKGEVFIKEIYAPSCSECADLSFLPEQLTKVGIKIKENKKITSSSLEGKELIQEYGIQALPALVFSKDLEEYWWLFPKIESLLLEKESGYLFTEPFFPNLELSNGKIKGKVSLTYLTANDCADCFNASKLKIVFQSAGIYFSQEKSINEASDLGKSLINKYNLSKIPTLIFSSEIMDYGEKQKEALSKVGTFEKDNSFVLRELDQFQVKYKQIKK